MNTNGAVIKNVFLTGDFGVGKSSAVAEIIKQLGCRFDGLITKRITENERTVGFSLSSICNENSHVFAHEDFDEPIRYDRFGIRPWVFDTYGVAILKNIGSETKLIVIDEVGIMEQQAGLFISQFLQILNGRLPVLAVVQKRADYIWRQVEGRKDSVVFRMGQGDGKRITDRIVAILRDRI